MTKANHFKLKIGGWAITFASDDPNKQSIWNDDLPSVCTEYAFAETIFQLLHGYWNIAREIREILGRFFDDSGADGVYPYAIPQLNGGCPHKAFNRTIGCRCIGKIQLRVMRQCAGYERK